MQILILKRLADIMSDQTLLWSDMARHLLFVTKIVIVVDNACTCTIDSMMHYTT